MKPGRVPVPIDRDFDDVFKATSQQTGIPVSRLVRDAMKTFRPEHERRCNILARCHSDEELGGTVLLGCRSRLVVLYQRLPFASFAVHPLGLERSGG